MVSNIFDAALNPATPWESFLFVITLILCLYPILGAMFWFFGAVSYMLFRHHEELLPNTKLENEPFITIMIPAHNEEVVIQSTLEYLLTKLHYHNYEILVMDDGSTDRTPEILLVQMALTMLQLRLIWMFITDQRCGESHKPLNFLVLLELSNVAKLP